MKKNLQKEEKNVKHRREKLKRLKNRKKVDQKKIKNVDKKRAIHQMELQVQEVSDKE